MSRERPELMRAGYAGSYVRGDWGVGSDLDVILVVDRADEPWEWRQTAWDATELPVPVDLFIFTEGEWARLRTSRGRHPALMTEIVWVYKRN